MARRKRKSSRPRKRRHNPSGGFLPALGGFFAFPIVAGLASRATTLAVPLKADEETLSGATDLAYRTAVLDVGGAVAAWAGRDRVRDPGWKSFLAGGMWGSIVGAVILPVAAAFGAITTGRVVRPASTEDVENIPVG